MATIDSNKTYPKEKSDLSAVKRKRDEAMAKIAKLQAKAAAVEAVVSKLEKEIFAREDGRTLAAVKILLQNGTVPGLQKAIDKEKEKLEIGSGTNPGRPAATLAKAKAKAAANPPAPTAAAAHAAVSNLIHSIEAQGAKKAS